MEASRGSICFEGLFCCCCLPAMAHRMSDHGWRAWAAMGPRATAWRWFETAESAHAGRLLAARDRNRPAARM